MQKGHLGRIAEVEVDVNRALENSIFSEVSAGGWWGSQHGLWATSGPWMFCAEGAQARLLLFK